MKDRRMEQLGKEEEEEVVYVDGRVRILPQDSPLAEHTYRTWC
jgi:hypothetical protein